MPHAGGPRPLRRHQHVRPRAWRRVPLGLHRGLRRGRQRTPHLRHVVHVRAHRRPRRQRELLLDRDRARVHRRGGRQSHINRHGDEDRRPRGRESCQGGVLGEAPRRVLGGLWGFRVAQDGRGGRREAGGRLRARRRRGRRGVLRGRSRPGRGVRHPDRVAHERGPPGQHRGHDQALRGAHRGGREHRRPRRARDEPAGDPRRRDVQDPPAVRDARARPQGGQGSHGGHDQDRGEGCRRRRRVKSEERTGRASFFTSRRL
mmetsp:Transcript_8222/g.34895  ORF Transcript_8222/g.34895 Transcript_8222/m.34895 type:complete len:260 (+) Transcript_8222:245-1024(+)